MRIAEENWKVLALLFPAGSRQMAWQSGAVERLRGFPSAEVLLRMLMLHVARGHLLRETKVSVGRSGCRVVGPVLAHNFRVADNRELGIVQMGFCWKLDGSRGFTKAKWRSSPARAMRTSSRRSGSHTAAKECRRIPCAPPELVRHNVPLGCSESPRQSNP